MNQAVAQLERVLAMGIPQLQSIVVPVMIAMTIIGLVIGVFGLKLARVWSALIGLLIGAGVGAIIAIFAEFTGMITLGVVAGCALVFAIIGAIVYKIGMFFFVIFNVATLCIAMIPIKNEMLLAGIGVGVGIVAAIVTMIVFDPLVIVITSVVGGFLAGSSIVTLVHLESVLLANILIPVVLIIVFGFLQFFLQSKKIGKKQEKNADEYKKNASMETEVEQARNLLDEDSVYEEDDTEFLDDMDDLENDDFLDEDEEDFEGFLDEDEEFDEEFDDDFTILE